MRKYGSEARERGKRGREREREVPHVTLEFPRTFHKLLSFPPRSRVQELFPSGEYRGLRAANFPTPNACSSDA